MASALYTSAKLDLLSGSFNLASDDIRAILTDNGAYTFSAAHSTLADVAAGARIAVSANLASKAVTGGVFDAADVTFSAVTGTSCESLVLYKHTGAESAHLLCYIDSFASGMPVTPNGGDVSVVFDNGANKIFAL